MGSIVRRLIDRFFPSNQGPTVTIAGLDYSGKTTLLYLLKVGEVVTTIPTIGFNVETVDLALVSGHQFRMTAWDVGAGCGGMSHLYGMMHLYITNGDALVWVVDSRDRDRFPESVEELEGIMLRFKDEMSDKKIPILILANKSDLPGGMSLDEIRLGFSRATSGQLASVFKTTLCNPSPDLKSTGLLEAFDWLKIAIDIAKAKLPPPSTVKPRPANPGIQNPRDASMLAQKLESWLTRSETDMSSEEFLEKFRSFSLPSWDHYTHIRIAYVILAKYGRKEGKDMIFEGLERYITTSPATRGRSFHVSMTYFWIQIVHFGISNMPPPAEYSASHTARSTALLSPDDFARFLLINPHVVDGNMWTDYYSKDVLMSLKAKEEMVLPDKKPLPSLVIRDAIKKFGT